MKSLPRSFHQMEKALGSCKKWPRVVAGTIFIFLWDSSVNSAHAYLDPGTGAMLLQGIIAAVSGIAAVVLAKLSRIKEFIRSRSWGRARSTPEGDSAQVAEREPGSR